MNRRSMLRGMIQTSVAASLTNATSRAQESLAALPDPTPSNLPRWRGFNLLEMFHAGGDRPFREADFAWVAEFGFNFVRLPLDYRCWTDSSNWAKIREEELKRLDQALDLGRKHGIHVQFNFHRAPGYTVADPPERLSLWKDSQAQDVCAKHWGHFARRFQGVPARQLSFNLFNEPAKVSAETYRVVVERMVQAIREQDRQRLVICDGRNWGNTPPAELVGLDVATATRGYEPVHLTHYQASWMSGSDRWPVPTYPLHENGKTWDRARLKKERIVPWKELQGRGVGVMVGEFGSHNRTPHNVVISWMRDCLANWKEAGWGWALWNLRGSFGILDSDRSDVAYESWHGHKLDRVMLELLQGA